MAERSTLLTRLESEQSDLEERIRLSSQKTERLEGELSALKKVIGDLRKSIKKSNASISEMPRRTAIATA